MAFEYDLLVIGGGSAGIAAARRAGKMGKKVALLDFVKPSPQGTTWGLGGTCVNVGCIPKKLFHTAAIHGQSLKDAEAYGWKLSEGASITHDWATLVNAVSDHIGSTNWGYRVALRDDNVTYFNGYGKFVDAHTVESTDKKGKVTRLTAENILIAVGGRPSIPADIPGAAEHCHTSDDIFKSYEEPKRTVIVGASYVALEIAGFLQELGHPTTVLVRSILLRGHDQQMAALVGDYMANHGVKFLYNSVPVEITKDSNNVKTVSYKNTLTDEIFKVEADTVIFATGRYAVTEGINLAAAGVKAHKNGKIPVDENDMTNVAGIYALGDCREGGWELTPVAIEAGRKLVDRLFTSNGTRMDYDHIPTTVFTPLEYGSVGMTEEAAAEKYGEDNLEIWHMHFQPLEWTVAHREVNACYGKVVTLKSEGFRIIGFHYTGPNAGEVTQGYALAVKKGMTKDDLDDLVGIHPSCAEEFTTMTITKSSGVDPQKSGC